jgi:hypothetical protein
LPQGFTQARPSNKLEEVTIVMNEGPPKSALDSIRETIARSGQYIYVVSGGETPRFAYTIGVSESVGIELILAGAVFYMKDEVVTIINHISTQLKTQHDRKHFEVDELGSFALRQVHSTWTQEIMLGAFDYYKKRDIPALQIVPDKAHWTIDVPDMSMQWSSSSEPVWRWLKEPWTFPVPNDSTVATNLAALRGERITEVMRWEKNEWEMFAGRGPEVNKDDMRVVALGTLVASDKSLFPVVNLLVDEGLWRDRDPDSEWHTWGKGSQGKVQ